MQAPAFGYGGSGCSAAQFNAKIYSSVVLCHYASYLKHAFTFRDIAIVNPPHLSTLLPALKKVSSFNKDRVSLDNEGLVEIREEGEGGEGGRGGQLAQRRTKLPCPTPEMADFSLWSILRKNIGMIRSQQ